MTTINAYRCTDPHCQRHYYLKDAECKACKRNRSIETIVQFAGTLSAEERERLMDKLNTLFSAVKPC